MTRLQEDAPDTHSMIQHAETVGIRATKRIHGHGSVRKRLLVRQTNFLRLSCYQWAPTYSYGGPGQ